MARDSFFDRTADRVRLTEPLEIVGDPGVVVRVMTAVLWGGVVQILASILVFAAFDEPVVAWAVSLAALLFAAAWIWMVATGDVYRSILIATVAGSANIIAHIALGGYAYSGAAVFYGIVVTSILALILGRRAAVISGFGYGGFGIVAAFFERSLQESRTAPDPTLTTFIFVSVLVTSIAVIPFLIINLMGKVREERQRAESLLLNMLPAQVVDELKQEGSTTPRHFDSISVLFADIVGFTPVSAEMTPEEVVESLNTVFTHFDRLADEHGVEKIRTIGDSYMAAAGVPVPRADHARVLTAMALDMLAYAERTRFSFRIGINSGPVVAGVIGTHKFQYDVWGDTVNTAYRMESHGETGRVQITRSTNDLIEDAFVTTPRGAIEVKGKGILSTWFVEGVRSPE